MGTLKIVQICLVVFQVFPVEFCVDFTLRASNESQFKQFIGVINLESDFRICKEGDTLTPEQARLLVRNLLILKLTYSVCTELNWLHVYYIYMIRTHAVRKHALKAMFQQFNSSPELA